ncbi:MAG: 50S ribosomal protein L9 [Deltaproteobacteria bacterium]|jgi:large subunit ribosomal protein L9|nr:50S ribosomal protein L9 [Deltaproteobacteria bacterium]
MKVILTTEIDSLGLEGDTVNVARGYARNYLIPKGFALEATNQNIKLIEMQRKKIDERRLKAQEGAEKVKELFNEKVITIIQKAGDEKKLYGSVTTMDIAESLEKEGISIDRRKIVVDRPIKTLGEYEVTIKLHPKVTAKLKVIVAPEE